MRSFACLFGVPLTCIFAAASFAGETEDFTAAQKALDAVPVYRTVVEAKSSMQPGVNRMTMEVVRPDLARMKVELDGKLAMEEVTDGKKAVISEAGGPYKDAPPQAVAQIATTRLQASIVASNGDDLSHKVGQMKLTGHETLNGVPASVYTGSGGTDDRMSKMQSDVKIWISDGNHLPLQATWNAHGTLTFDPKEGPKPFSQEMKLNFDYDPSIKVELPPVPR